MKPYSRILVAFGAGVLALTATAAQADVVNLSVLNVDSFEGTTVNLGTTQYDYHYTFSPTLTLNMGGYAGTIFDQTDSHSSVTVLLQSTSDYGGQILSGTADTTNGTLDLDLSSLNVVTTLSGLPLYTGPIWSSSSPILQNTYNAATGAFTYEWKETSDVNFGAGSQPLTYDITLHGNGVVSTVPEPAAVWLFGAGLLGLIGVGARRRGRTQG